MDISNKVLLLVALGLDAVESKKKRKKKERKGEQLD